jgi:hypothetical protein
MTRYALLLGPQGRKRRMPITDLMELQDSYILHDDRYTVVGVFTVKDVEPKPEPERVIRDSFGRVFKMDGSGVHNGIGSRCR